MHKNDKTLPSRGSIIVTASNAGVYPFPIAPLYAAAKAGLINLVRSMGPALEKANIQINALAPAVLGKSTAEGIEGRRPRGCSQRRRAYY